MSQPAGTPDAPPLPVLDTRQGGTQPASSAPVTSVTHQFGSGSLGRGLIGFMLAHEQFRVPDLLELGARASQAGFRLLATSDHFQPWQANEGHSGAAWVTLGALGAQARNSWMGTTVTCPTLRYHPSVVAEAFASLSLLYPGRIFLGVGSGEALNEQAATGQWPRWQERWDRLVEAIGVIRQLWTGQPVSHRGQFYTVEGRLYDPPPMPIPLLTAANGPKSMRLAGEHGDGLITSAKDWKQHKSAWQAGARAAGKDPDKMPVLVEQYMVVGDQDAAREAAGLWRFGPKAFDGYYDIPSPQRIQERADEELPLQKVMDGWAIGTDPEVHISQLRELFDTGVSIVNLHTGQPDQQHAIEFYGEHVLPHFQQPVV